MSRLNTIEAKLVFYNANTDNNDSPDCVARSISLAFGTSYNTVKYQLRKFARNRNNGLVWNNVVNSAQSNDVPPMIIVANKI